MQPCTAGCGEGLRPTRAEPGEGPRSARVYPMSRRLSGQAAGLRLPGMRLACPQLTSRSAPSSRIRPSRHKNGPFDFPMHLTMHTPQGLRPCFSMKV